jgi:hypothetical protein
MTAPICPKHGLPGRYAWGSLVVCIREDEELQAERQSRTKTVEYQKKIKGWKSVDLIVQPKSIIGEKAFYNGKCIGVFIREPYQGAGGDWYAHIEHVTGHSWTVAVDPNDPLKVLRA